MLIKKNNRYFREEKFRLLEEKIIGTKIDRRKKLTSLFATTALAVFLGSSLYLWQFTKIVKYNRSLYELKQAISVNRQIKAKLSSDIAQLSAISRIKVIAQQQLSMVEPEQILYLNLN